MRTCWRTDLGVERMSSHAALNILFVEKDGRTRASVCDGLLDEGLKVSESADAEAAMDMLQRCTVPIDVVVTDSDFGSGRDGLFLADWVRKHYPRIAIAVASRSMSFRTAMPNLADGAAFVEAPYAVKTLVPFLYELVEERSSQVCS